MKKSPDTTVRLRKGHIVYNPTYAISAKNKYTTYTTQPNWTDKNSESYSSNFVLPLVGTVPIEDSKHVGHMETRT